MKIGIYAALIALSEKKITKICYCKPVTAGSPLCNLYFEFDDGSHVEIYADAEMLSPGLIGYDPRIGSIVDRTFAIAKTGAMTAVMVNDSGISYSKPLLYDKQEKT